MKNVPFLIYAVPSLLLLLACERKVDNDFVKVSLDLPARTLSRNYLESVTNPLQSYSPVPLTSSPSLADSSLNETKNLFNSVLPSLAAGAAVPVNCYLVVVSGPEEDFSKNHCSKKANPGEFSADDAAAPQLKFGPYVGLIDAFNYGGSVDMELRSGDARVFTLLGFNAVNSCSEIFTAMKNKSKLSKAYRLGTSAPVKLTPGAGVVDVPIRMVAEVDADDYFSDCVIPDPETIYPIFKLFNISLMGFPHKLRSFAADPGSEFMCEAVDLAMVGVDPYTRFDVNGTVDQDTYFSLQVGNSAVSTYDTEQDCVSGTGAGNSFRFLRNQTAQRRWFRQQRFTSALTNIRVTYEDGQPVYSRTFRQENRETAVFFDTILPPQLQAEVCYEVTSLLRDFHGNVMPNPSDINITNTETPTSFYVRTFSTLADCEGENNANAPMVFSAFWKSFTYWIKLSDDITSFEYALTLSGTSAVQAEPPVKARGPQVPATASPDLAALRDSGPGRIPNYTTMPAGTVNCNPLFVSFMKEDGDAFVLGTNASVSLAGLKVQVADPTGPETDGYTLYSDESCSYVINPVGSAAEPAGSVIQSPAPGSAFYKLYVKTDGGLTFGQRRLMFYYQGKAMGYVRFNLTDPAH